MEIKKGQYWLVGGWDDFNFDYPTTPLTAPTYTVKRSDRFIVKMISTDISDVNGTTMLCKIFNGPKPGAQLNIGTEYFKENGTLLTKEEAALKLLKNYDRI